MDRKQWMILAFGTVSVVGAATAIAQVNQALGSRPTETTLQPSRADSAALAEARQNPLASRLRIALANDANYARILGQAQASAVPVLVPPNPGLIQTARLYPGDRQYTLVVRPPGQIVEILGSTRALQAPEGTRLPPPETRGAGASTRVTRQTPLAAAVTQGQARGLSDIRTERTEYGVDVSFLRFGALYSITFVCDDQASLECSNAAAVQFASQLELIGGGQ